FPLPFGALGLLQHLSHVQLPGVEVDHRDEPELVPADVEHRELADLIGGVERLADIRKALPVGVSSYLIPRLKRRLGLRVFLPELAELLLGNDMHAGSLANVRL